MKIITNANLGAVCLDFLAGKHERQKREIVRLFSQGLGAKKICKELGIKSTSYIYRAIGKAEAKHIYFSRDERQFMIELFSDMLEGGGDPSCEKMIEKILEKLNNSKQ